MNELNHVAARLHSWAWSTAAAELMVGRGSGKESPQVIQMSSASPHVDAQTYAALTSAKKATFSKHPSNPFLLPFPGAYPSCLQARGGAHPGQLHPHNSLVLLHSGSFKRIWIFT